MKKIKTLIVDDSRQFCEAIEVQLKNDVAIEVVGLLNGGKECLKFIVKNSVDLVLMDARMPDLDGPQTTVKLKKIRPRIKVIICTIWEKAEAKQYAEQAGAEGYFVKGEPVKILLKKIHKLFPR